MEPRYDFTGQLEPIPELKEKLIMIIGAGALQTFAIRRAKAIGLRVLATDRNLRAEGFEYVDIPAVVDTRDIEASVAVAEAFEVDGVMSDQTDMAVRTVAAVADSLKLVGISPSSAFNATHKGAMRERLKEHGVPSPASAEVEDLNGAWKAVLDINLPVIFKPTDSLGGSRGVVRVEKKEDIERCYNIAKSSSFDNKVIVEEFMEGEEHTVECFTWNGKTHVLATSDKFKGTSFYQVSTSITFPSALPEDVLKEMESVTKRTVEALGIKLGPTHTEIITTEDGPKVVELGARGGGGRISSDIVPLVSGVDMVAENVKMVMGSEPDVERRQHRAAVLRFFTPPTGRINKITGFEDILNLPGVVDAGMRIREGDVLTVLKTDVERAGYVITTAEDREEAVRIANLAEDTLKIDVTPLNRSRI